MESHYSIFDRRPIVKARAPSVKWFREWVPQDVVATGGRCSLLRWVTEDDLKVLKEREKEPNVAEPEPEPTTEVLFLCSFDGCGKTFIDVGALRKHSHIHGERQYVCHYEGCGKKFLDSSKLKRHFLIHTGERHFLCPIEGCGKAFSLDFNLRSHMKTHSQENYHICPYPDCGKRYAHEYKLRNHIVSHHEKSVAIEVPKYTPPLEKPSRVSKPSCASSDRPFACPYDGCEKAYIHEYKLKLHLRREHPGHMAEENPDQEMDEASDQETYTLKRPNNGKTPKQSKRKARARASTTKAVKRKALSPSPPAPMAAVVKKPWLIKGETYEEEDSEETEEEDRINVEDGWRYTENNEEDDEETEYEDQ
ncbi:hypothetical protein SAY86_023214 [Trapa natans]|uniref:C2H2-type domain-containing protein n=1 Tax=Trapa natans TaxID=22666 RepID=A0AAN7LWW5_TRANT|nr:hypothetical protein SAY86_023214 [Trapa natans]